MGKIWYESHFHLRFAYFLPFIVLGATILLFILEINYLKKRYSAPEQGIKIAKIFFSGMIAFESILIFIAIISQIDMYKETAIAYQNGDYQIVEGYVENFEPMGRGGGWEPEEFEINGVKFEYSDARLISGGYYRAKGDCIIADGQHLKVGYVNFGGWGNIIVYIENLP